MTCSSGDGRSDRAKGCQHPIRPPVHVVVRERDDSLVEEGQLRVSLRVTLPLLACRVRAVACQLDDEASVELRVDSSDGTRSGPVDTLHVGAWQAGTTNQRQEASFEPALAAKIDQRADQAAPVRRIHGQLVEYAFSKSSLADHAHAHCRINGVVDLPGRESEQQRVEDQPLRAEAANAVDRDEIAGSEWSRAGSDGGSAGSISIRPRQPQLDRSFVESIQSMQRRSRSTTDRRAEAKIAER